MIGLPLLLVLLSGVAVDDAVTGPRLEQMLEDGEDVLIVQTFQRHPTQVLSFIDGYLEGGLKMIEEGEDGETAQDSLRTGVLFGELASVAFGDDVFLEYAASFASWSPKEQQNFRLGQREYREGRELEEKDAAGALAKFRSSYKLANALHDTWGRAMAAGGLARAHRALGENRAAQAWARHGAELYRRVRLEDNEIALLVLSIDLLDVEEPRRREIDDVARAWTLLKERPRDETNRQKVLETYRAFLRQAGRTDEAESLDQEVLLPE